MPSAIRKGRTRNFAYGSIHEIIVPVRITLSPHLLGNPNKIGR
jgi:hypothetical protein